MRHWFILILGMLILACAAVSAADFEDITPAPDLAGWQALGGQWTVEDGVVSGLARKEENAWLLWTGRTLADFELTLEFRTPVPTNGGVQFRSHWLPRLPLQEGETAETVPKQMYGYQANIETRQRAATGRLVDENGRGPLAEADEAALKTLKQKDWNVMTVRALDSRIEVELNGVPAVRYEDEAFIKGYLALQSFAWDLQGEAAAVEYRNIRLRDLGRTGQWRTLFDGKSFDGWKEWGEEGWTIEDGVIVGRCGPKKSEGYLATLETWKDFRVRGQFRMLGEGNYGLFYHATIQLREDGYPVISGLQGEVAPEYPSPTGWIYESYKRGWLEKPDMTRLAAWALRPGEWNEIEIRCVGNRITTWVNGVRAVNITDEGQQLFEGSFALQLHTGGSAGIMWRDLNVREP